MYRDGKIYMGLGDDGQQVTMQLNMSNRHGLIAGASGTGKTITMKIMAESFSDAGVPVFLCDVKGDVSGLAAPGVSSEDMEKRIDHFGVRDSFQFRSYPVCFWDIYQEKGHPVRATISDMGPELLARILKLSPAQEGVLNIVFRIADDKGLLLIDIKDLRALLNYVSEHREEYMTTYGNISTQSVGALLRTLLPLEKQGGELFFAEPALDIFDWLRTDASGRGIINILDSVKLVQNPTLYATFLLWMMAELYEQLPEVGDMEKPKLVFFFDEAHMLFTDAPKVLVQKIEQVVKLIRSKGVGIYFVTQNPADIPDSVLAQLSNRVQHALRAYTPAEQKAVRVAAQSFRANPAFKTEDVIMELGVGYALTSFLDEEGVPAMAQKTAVICPQSMIGPVDEGQRQSLMVGDGMSKYDEYVDRESAYELLEDERELNAREKALAEERAQFEKEKEAYAKQKEKEDAAALKKQEKEEEAAQRKREREEEAAQRKKEKEEEAAQRKKEKEEEAALKKKEREAERRKAQIERSLISTGTQILKRGLMNTLFNK